MLLSADEEESKAMECGNLNVLYTPLLKRISESHRNTRCRMVSIPEQSVLRNVQSWRRVLKGEECLAWQMYGICGQVEV